MVTSELQCPLIPRHRVGNVGIKEREAAQDFVVSRNVIPANSQIQRQLGIDLVIVLEIGGNRMIPPTQHPAIQLLSTRKGGCMVEELEAQIDESVTLTSEEGPDGPTIHISLGCLISAPTTEQCGELLTLFLRIVKRTLREV